jgi:PmbA protein
VKHELLEIGEKAIHKAGQLGADQSEVYLVSSKSFSIDVENNSIKSATEKRDAGCGIRSVVEKKIGFAYVTTLLESDILESVTKSVKLAEAAVPDPDFISLPSFNGVYPTVKGIFDSSIKNMSSEKAADLIIRTVDATKDTLKDMKVAVEAKIGTRLETRVVINSLGISNSETSTYISLYSYPIVKAGSEQTSGYDYQISRDLKEINPEWIGQSAGESAIRSFGAKTVENADMPVLLDPLSISEFIGAGFGEAINAEEIQYGRSYITDAIGDAIASKELTIVDDAVQIGGVKSRAFDTEGFPSQHTEIISSGVLKGILHNSYTANKEEVDNTGNANRPSYKGVPYVSPSNFVITPGKGSQDDLISEIRKGIFCRFTADTPNMTTGDLSAVVMEGYFIENGEIKHPLKNTLIGINMKDLLQKVYRIGEDVRVMTKVVSPSIVIESAKITSG